MANTITTGKRFSPACGLRLWSLLTAILVCGSSLAAKAQAPSPALARGTLQVTLTVPSACSFDIGASVQAGAAPAVHVDCRNELAPLVESAEARIVNAAGNEVSVVVTTLNF